MEQLDLLMQGFAGALTPMNLLWVVVGCLLGTAVGEGLFDFGLVDGPAAGARFQHPLGVTLLPDRTLAGRFETIDATGALVLATDEGRVVLPAAEVHFAAGH